MAKPGSIAWHDLTVDDADSVRDFYASVVGWTHSAASMGDYSDYVMESEGDGVAGVCHRRGGNADIPAQWLMYVIVADLDHSLAEVKAHGGKIVVGPKDMGTTARYCIIQDPAGAVLGLYQELAT